MRNLPNIIFHPLATDAVLLAVCLGVLPAVRAAEALPSRPNILWISSEDHGPHMGCYGDTFATTPNVDKLAARGMIYTHVWSCAPVCAPPARRSSPECIPLPQAQNTCAAYAS